MNVIKGCLVLVVTACTSAQKMDDAGQLGRDSGVDGGSQQSPEAGTRDSGSPADFCRGKPALALEAVPEDVFAFHHLSAACEALKTKILLRNHGSNSVTIDELEISPGQFSATAEVLPRELAPGDTLSVAIGFASDKAEAIEGVLTVLSKDTCVELPVYGDAVIDSLLSQSDLAIDFGAVTTGSTSAPREIVIISLRSPASSSITLGGFSISPEDVFQFVDVPASEVEPSSCEEIKLSAMFKAPARPGRVVGDLSWYVTTTLDGVTYESIGGIELFGAAVTP